MIWMVARELLPETVRQLRPRRAAAWSAGSCLAMFAFQTYLLS
jgi:hypothetical protein